MLLGHAVQAYRTLYTMHVYTMDASGNSKYTTQTAHGVLHFVRTVSDSCANNLQNWKSLLDANPRASRLQNLKLPI